MDYFMEAEKQLSCKESYEVTPLFSLKLFMTLLKKFEEAGTFRVIL